jgi:hypothetical protein
MFSLIGFISAFLVHFLTVLGVNLFALSNYTFILHALIFIPFFSMIFSARTTHPNLEKGGFNKLLLSRAPKKISLFFKIILIYVAINFVIGLFSLNEGHPEIGNGVYIIEDRGDYVRDISQQEYHALKRMELRMFSGHWLVFFLVPTLYFRYTKKNT